MCIRDSIHTVRLKAERETRSVRCTRYAYGGTYTRFMMYEEEAIVIDTKLVAAAPSEPAWKVRWVIYFFSHLVSSNSLLLTVSDMCNGVLYSVPFI